MKIMIVDDNELMRKEIIRSVAFADDVVLECSSGESAVDNCPEFNPDWILMDIKMKNMNGILAAEKIKSRFPLIKIAFVTSYDNYAYRQRAKSIGIEFYFLKDDLLLIRKAIQDKIKICN